MFDYQNVMETQDAFSAFCLQCFDAVGWAAGPVKNEWCGSGTGMVICLERDADLHMAQLMPLPLIASCFSNPDWFYVSGTGSPG